MVFLMIMEMIKSLKFKYKKEQFFIIKELINLYFVKKY